MLKFYDKANHPFDNVVEPYIFVWHINDQSNTLNKIDTVIMDDSSFDDVLIYSNNIFIELGFLQSSHTFKVKMGDKTCMILP